jgi:hypothetical protein
VTRCRPQLVHHAVVACGYLHSQDLKRIGHRQADATVEMMEGQLILIFGGGFIGFLPAHFAAAWVARGELRCLCDMTLSYDSTFYAVSQSAPARTLWYGGCWQALPVRNTLSTQNSRLPSSGVLAA